MSDQMPPPPPVGLAVLKLLCPNGTHAATLIKRVAHMPIYISIPGQADVQWPREQDSPLTTVQASGACYSAVTSQLATRMATLSADEFDHEDSYELVAGD